MWYFQVYTENARESRTVFPQSGKHYLEKSCFAFALQIIGYAERVFLKRKIAQFYFMHQRRKNFEIETVWSICFEEVSSTAPNY